MWKLETLAYEACLCVYMCVCVFVSILTSFNILAMKISFSFFHALDTVSMSLIKGLKWLQKILQARWFPTNRRATVENFFL